MTQYASSECDSAEFTTTPPPDRSIAGSSDPIATYVARHPDSATSPGWRTLPGLFTARSRRPNAFVVASIAWPRECGSPRSVGIGSACPPAFWIARAVRMIAGSSAAATLTATPAEASAAAVAVLSRPAPTITATFPARSEARAGSGLSAVAVIPVSWSSFGGDSNAPRSVAERHRPGGGSSATPSGVGGAGAVEARTTSSVGNTTFAGSSSGESSSLAAAAPLS
jgi:hypothetical protein